MMASLFLGGNRGSFAMRTAMVLLTLAWEKCSRIRSASRYVAARSWNDMRGRVSEKKYFAGAAFEEGEKRAECSAGLTAPLALPLVEPEEEASCA